MKRVALAVALCAGPVYAENMTPEVCKASVSPLVALSRLPDLSPTIDPLGRCAAIDVVLFEDETMTLRADRIYWQLVGAERWIEHQLPPYRVDLGAEGIRLEPRTGDVILDYLLKTQAKRDGVSAEFVVEWNEGSNKISVEAAYVDFGPLGYIDASATLSEIDLSSQLALQTSVLSAALTQLSLTVQTTGLFETFALIPLGTIVLEGEADPARAAAIIKSHRISDIREFDSPAIGDASKEALIQLVEEMPNPNGRLDFTFVSDDGLALFLLGSTFFGNPFNADADPFAIFNDDAIAINWTPLTKP